jgi:molybdate transport system substrate-binding protein
MRGGRGFWCLIFGICGLAGCTPPASSTADANAKAMLFAASSTTEACQRLATQLSETQKGEVKLNFASSSALANQILNGAPADLFLSAHEQWADSISDAGLAVERIDLLGNRVVMVASKDSPIEVAAPEDLKSEKIVRIAIGEWNTVPAGIYAKQALENVGLWKDVEPKLAPQANVRQALSLVELQEAEVGLVYFTDAKISEKVRIVYVFDESTHDPIRYPLLLLKNGESNSIARAYYDLLRSPAARDVFEELGFEFIASKPER